MHAILPAKKKNFLKMITMTSLQNNILQKNMLAYEG
jgi:hypothetical protein